LKLAKVIAALKAVSQNLMHSNISITDGVYGILSDTDVKGQISALGNDNISKGKTEIEFLADMIIERIKKEIIKDKVG
jgi:hypothetical protein